MMNVLAVDHYSNFDAVYNFLFPKSEYFLDIAKTHDEAQYKLEKSAFDIAIVCENLNPDIVATGCTDGTGLELLKDIKNRYPGISKILITEDDKKSISGIGKEFIHEYDLDDIIVKPWDAKFFIEIRDFVIRKRLSFNSIQKGGITMTWLTTLKAAADVISSSQKIADFGKNVYDWFSNLIDDSDNENAQKVWDEFKANPNEENRDKLVDAAEQIKPDGDPILEGYLLSIAKQKLDENDNVLYGLLSSDKYTPQQVEYICRAFDPTLGALGNKFNKIEACGYVVGLAKTKESQKIKLIKLMLEVNPDIIAEIVKLDSD